MQYRSPASGIPSCQRPAATMRPLLRRSARLLRILATGSTRLGPVSPSSLSPPPSYGARGSCAADLMIAESDLKEWLDTHGFPAPQPSTVSGTSDPVGPLDTHLIVPCSVTSSSPRSVATLAWLTSSRKSSLPVPVPVPRLHMRRSLTSSSIHGASLS